MGLKTIKNIDLKNKVVLMRVDFNVPLKDGTVTDDTRIVSSLPSITHIIERGAKLILISHLGRPNGEFNTKYSLKPVAAKLAQILEARSIKTKVHFVPEVIGQEVEAAIKSLARGEIILLENVRFYKEEEDNDQEFAKKLAALADIYVNDAFGTAHRAHASTEGLAHFIPAYAGFLIDKEISFFEPILKNPTKPLIAVIGGAKVSSKIAVLESLLKTTATFIIGGGMAYTFLKVQGFNVGKSLVEEDYLTVAKQFLQRAAEKSVQVILPIDHLCAISFDENASSIEVDSTDIPENLIAMDIGIKSIEIMKAALSHAKTIIWNGPMGVFEFKHFEKGTQAIAQAIADSKALTVVGGGDSVAAANKYNLVNKFSHVSTGGGASLEYLEGRTLPGIHILQE